MPLLPVVIRRALAAFTALAAVTGLALPAAAGELRVSELGWWSRQPGATAPEGGFAVADAPDDAVSVAALRVPTDGPVVFAHIALMEVSGRSQDVGALRACVTTNEWRPAAPGPYSEAPKPDCGISVQLRRDAEARKWRADLTPLFAGRSGVVSVMVLPLRGESSSPLGAVGFSIEFRPPLLEGATSSPAPASTTTTTSTTAAPVTSPPAATAAPLPSPPTNAPSTAAVAPLPAVQTTRAPASQPAPPTAAQRSPATTVATGAPSSSPTTAASAAPPVTSATTGAPSDRVRGIAFLPYVVVALVVGIGAALLKLALDRGFSPSGVMSGKSPGAGDV